MDATGGVQMDVLSSAYPESPDSYRAVCLAADFTWAIGLFRHGNMPIRKLSTSSL